jgi:hypothetical protein
MKQWFIKMYYKGEGFFKQNVSIELKLYVFILIGLALYGIGYLVGKLT